MSNGSVDILLAENVWLSQSKDGLTPLRLLLLEDTDADADLVLHELRRGGFDATPVRARTAAEFRELLGTCPDLVIADFALPDFTAIGALQAMAERGMDVPCIVVSGTMSDEDAVSCMRHGATDYLLKDRLARLGEAVRHALEARRLRLEKNLMDADLQRREEQYASLLSNIPDAVWTAQEDGRCIFASDRIEEVLGYTPAEIEGNLLWHENLHPEDEPGILHAWQDLFETGRPFDSEYRIRHKAGHWSWVHGRAVRTYERNGVRCADGISTDITEHKRSDERLGVLESHRVAHLTVANLLSEATSVEQIMPPVLEALCTPQQWRWSAFWKVQDETLSCQYAWQSPHRPCRALAAASREMPADREHVC